MLKICCCFLCVLSVKYKFFTVKFQSLLIVLGLESYILLPIQCQALSLLKNNNFPGLSQNYVCKILILCLLLTEVIYQKISNSAYHKRNINWIQSDNQHNFVQKIIISQNGKPTTQTNLRPVILYLIFFLPDSKN